MAVSQRMQGAQVLRRVHPHARRALDERLDDERGERRSLGGERPLRFGDRGRQCGARVEPLLPAKDVRRRQAHGRPDRVRHEAMKCLRVADPDRAQRVAMIRFHQRREARAPCVAAELVVLQGDPERDFDRRRSGVGVEDAGQSRWNDRRELVRELDRRRARETEKRRVRDATRLRPERLVERGVAMPVHVAPQRRYAIQVSSPAGIDQPAPVALDDDERILVEPVAHLGERMPQMGMVPADECRGIDHQVPAVSRAAAANASSA